MTSEDNKKNESIARVAYLIAAADGNVNKGEREVFKKTLKAIQGFEFGTPETTAFIERIIADADSLVRLRDFYDDDEIIKALMAKIADDLLVIKEEKVALRKAFTVWISICVADGTFSDFERRIVKGLQASCNVIVERLVGKFPIGGVAMGAALAGGLLGPFAALPVGLAAFLGTLALKPVERYGVDAAISDDFLSEVESRCFMIDKLVAQLEASADELEKEGLQMSINGLVDSFKDFIENPQH